MNATQVCFFPRQTVLQDGSNATTYYSDPFDVAAYEQIVVELRAYAVQGTNPQIDVSLESSMSLHPSDGQFHTDLTFTTVTSGGGTPQRIFVVGPVAPTAQFVRVKIEITGTDVAATLEVVALARS